MSRYQLIPQALGWSRNFRSCAARRWVVVFTGTPSKDVILSQQKAINNPFTRSTMLPSNLQHSFKLVLSKSCTSSRFPTRATFPATFVSLHYIVLEASTNIRACSFLNLYLIRILSDRNVGLLSKVHISKPILLWNSAHGKLHGSPIRLVPWPSD